MLQPVLTMLTNLVRTPYPNLPQVELFGFDPERANSGQITLPAIFRSYQVKAQKYFEEEEKKFKSNYYLEELTYISEFTESTRRMF